MMKNGRYLYTTLPLWQQIKDLPFAGEHLSSALEINRTSAGSLAGFTHAITVTNKI